MRFMSKRSSALRRKAALSVLGSAVFAWAAAGAGSAPEQKLQGPYLGQPTPGTTPRIFAPGFVSTPAHEFGASFTPDGKAFYFTRRDPNRNVNLIMVSTSIDGTWTEPKVAPFLDNWEAFEPRVTPDGRRLYFTSNKPLPGGGDVPMSIWYVEKRGEGWSGPKDPGSLLNPMKSMYVSMTLDGTIYTTDISGGPGTEGIAVARQTEGKYRKLERLGPPVNTGTTDMYPFIAPDESYLIFTSRRPPTNTRGGGLWIAFKQPDGAWSDPRVIDLGMEAGLPLVSPDGKYLFFTAGERGKSDIYWGRGEVHRAVEAGPGRQNPGAVLGRPDQVHGSSSFLGEHACVLQAELRARGHGSLTPLSVTRPAAPTTSHKPNGLDGWPLAASERNQGPDAPTARRWSV